MLRLTACTLALAAAGLAQAGSVNVLYYSPEMFRDAGLTPAQRAETLTTLRQHLESLGGRLEDGRMLSIDVLDIDVAAATKPWRGGPMLTVGNGGWPTMHVRYTLQVGDRVLSRGEDWISDMGHTAGIVTTAPLDPLRSEKRMLDRWFDAKFAAR